MFLTASIAAPIPKRGPEETRAALSRAHPTTFQGEHLITQISGVPETVQPAYRLSTPARRQLRRYTAQLITPTYRSSIIVAWARHRSRVSSTEVADLIGISVVRAGQILTELEQEGLLIPGCKVKAGRGFFYVPAPPSDL